MPDPFGALTPDELGLSQLPASMGPMAPPPTLQSFLPKQNLADKIAPLAVLATALLAGKGANGLAQGFAHGQAQQQQGDLQKAQLFQQDALRQQGLQQQMQLRQQADEEKRRQVLLGATQSIKNHLATIRDKSLYDEQVDGYAAQLQQAGYRVTSNALRVQAPYVAPNAKQIAGEAVSAWLKNPANAEALKKDPTIVGKAFLQIDTNNDGVVENVPLVRAGQIAGIQFAADETGKPLAIDTGGDPKVGSAFQETYKAGLARFVAENQRQPTPKEKQTLVSDAIKGAKEAAPEDVPPTLSPAGLDAAALNYAKTGTLPAMGMSKSSAGVRAKIINRAAELYPGLDVAGNKGAFAANETALKKLATIANTTEAAARTATDNLDLALAQSGEVARTGSKLANRYLQWVQGQLSPAEGLTQFETYVYTAAREYAKVTSGGSASAQGLTDSAAKEASKLLNTAQSPRAFAAAVRAMKADMGNVGKNYKAQVGDLQTRMRGMGQPPPVETPTEPPVGTPDEAIIAARKRRPQ